jgi:hypothetical protein
MQQYMMIVAYLGTLQNFTRLGGRAGFLRPFVELCLSGLIEFRDGSDRKCASHFVQMLENIRQRPWQRLLDNHLGGQHGLFTGVSNEEPKLIETPVGLSQEHGDCCQRIRSGWPYSQFRILLRRFTTNTV